MFLRRAADSKGVQAAVGQFSSSAKQHDLKVTSRRRGCNKARMTQSAETNLY
jgi:hypothetical protein